MPKKVQLTELGKFLRKFRAVNNMTAEELARDLGISSTLLYKLETGQRNATFDFYQKCRKSPFFRYGDIRHISFCR